MIADLNSSGPHALFAADICIIGTGAAGLALARALRESGLSVLLLESGGESLEPESQSLYEAQISGQSYVGHLKGRFRIFGGSTTRWGGQASPLGELDLQRRPWVAHSGWPISHAEIAAYFPQASRHMGIDQCGYDRELFESFGYEPPAFDPKLIHFHFAKWSARPNLREVYRKELAAAAQSTILLHANVTEIRLSENLHTVTEVHVRSLAGKSGIVRADRFILAAGGIESARLLLLSDRQSPGGVGNGNGNVGRYFHDHPAATVGVVRTTKPRRLQRVLGMFHRQSWKYSLRMSAAPEWQEAQQLLNVSATLRFSPREGSAVESLRQGYHLLRAGKVGPALARHALRSLRGLPSSGSSLWALYVRSRSYIPDPRMYVTLISEQEPTPDSCITLSDQRDSLGQRRANIHWQLTDLTWATFAAYASSVKSELERLGLCQLELEPWLLSGADAIDWRTRLMDQNHHMGATRMSLSPVDGVVDRDLRVHGIDNLYIASTSVFPTGGHSNPTFNMLALTFRLAEKLKREKAAKISRPARTMPPP